MKVDVVGSNSLLFENLPPASQVPGRTYRVSDVGPAPGILLTSDGTKYRPTGGRQVLAQRSNNPVTWQNTTLTSVETIGPFPGGLVRDGMQLNFDASFSSPGISSSTRQYRLRIGKGATATVSVIPINANQSGNSLSSRGSAVVEVRSDSGGANHRVGMQTLNPYQAFGTGASEQYFALDFSSPWLAQVFMASVAETAVNISSATWAGGIATFNTAAVHTLAVGDKTVTAEVTPAGWNIPAGAIVLSVPTSTQFTVALAADPGTYSTGGTSSRISNMISQSYVLELVG